LKGDPQFLARKTPSEKDLGHLDNSADPVSPNVEWIGEICGVIILSAHDQLAILPERINRLPITKTSVRSQKLHKAIRFIKEGKNFPQFIKVFNFMHSSGDAKPFTGLAAVSSIGMD
jgi:hypothetical protein